MLKIFLTRSKENFNYKVSWGISHSFCGVFKVENTLPSLVLHTLLCGQRQHEPAQQCWQPQLCPYPSAPSPFPLYFSIL